MSSVSRITLPPSSPGTHRELVVHRFGDPEARPKAYFQAALHADEWPGLLVAQHLLRRLEQAERDGRLQGQVVVVPVANPVGLAQYLNGRLVGRFDFEGGENFNRGYPDITRAAVERVRDRLGDDAQANAALLREALRAEVAALPRPRETDALKLTLLELAVDADLVLDLHCDREGLLHIYANHRHRDITVELARVVGAPVVLLEDEPGGHPFDEANAAPWWQAQAALEGVAPLPLGCFACTVELRGQADIDDRHARADADRLMEFLVRRGVLRGEPRPLPEAQPLEAPLNAVDLPLAPGAGIVAYRKALGERVARGEVVAELVDLTAPDPEQARTPIISRTDGILFVIMERMARPGQRLCKIAGTRPLAHRRLGALLED